MKTEVVLKANNLKKSFYYPHETTIINNLSLEIYEGESVAIMGRSGQGKSTLLQLLGTLDNPCQGSIEIAGKKVNFFNKSKIRSNHLAFVFQSFHLMEDYTALENILMPAFIKRLPIGKNSESYLRAMELLELVQLSDHMHHGAKLLSGGEKQRIALARAMINQPDVILADEPSGNLDRETAKKIHEILIDYTKRNRKSLVVVTHDESLAKLCDTVYFLNQGMLELM